MNLVLVANETVRQCTMPQRFKIIRWKRQWSDLRVVWINVAKLDAAWKLDDDYIVIGKSDLGGRYQNFGRFLLLYDKPIWMPTVSPLEGGAVGFTDGRHRFSWVRDHGVTSMPVGTGWEDFDALKRLCGSRSRTCRLPLPIRRRPPA